ncbi:MAG: hypothetical protein OXC62_10125, partial [Aestuariivita sp.]|nr:hypothetical protein [Aestuariivita sp.]
MVRLSFGGKYNELHDIAQNLRVRLDVIELNTGLQASVYQTAPERFLDLFDHLHYKAGTATRQLTFDPTSRDDTEV